MFTGIIETLGSIESVIPSKGGRRLVVRLLGGERFGLPFAFIGDSIAVNGVCLTVEPSGADTTFTFFASTETLRRTTLSKVSVGTRVNLERALKADSRLGGHMVLGHVDGIGTIRQFAPKGEGWFLEVEYPHDLARLIAPKGSIAVDGISLTSASVNDRTFTAALIPHTVHATHLQFAAVGQSVNLEVDVLARYIVRAMDVDAKTAQGQTESKAPLSELLLKAGF